MDYALAQYLAVLYNGPMLQGDVIVGLMGEDADIRLSVCLEVFRQTLFRLYGAPTIVLSGAESEEPHKRGAAKAAGWLLGEGVAPDLILVEPMATNTHEQAVECLKLTTLNDWRRVLLVASAYHLPRALLTFVAELNRTGMADRVDVVPIPACAPWSDLVPMCRYTRSQAFAMEVKKIQSYSTDIQSYAHVATYSAGIEYLEGWEQRRREVPDATTDS